MYVPREERETKVNFPSFSSIQKIRKQWKKKKVNFHSQENQAFIIERMNKLNRVKKKLHQ